MPANGKDVVARATTTFTCSIFFSALQQRGSSSTAEHGGPFSLFPATWSRETCALPYVVCLQPLPDNLPGPVTHTR